MRRERQVAEIPYTVRSRGRGVGGGNYLPEAEALFARMYPTPSTSRKLLINTLINNLITYGVWAEVDVLYVVGTTPQHSLLNWKSDTYNGVLNGTEDFIADRGFKGDGTTTFIETDYNPADDGAQYTQYDGSAGGGLQDSITDGILERAICGLRSDSAIVGSGYASSWVRPYGPSNFIEFRMNTTATQVTSATIENGSHWSLSRLNTDIQYTSFKNGAVLATFTTGTTTSPPPPRPMTFRFMRHGNHPTQFSNARHTYFFIGGGLTDQQMSDFYYSMNEYLAAIGAEERVYRPEASIAMSMSPQVVTQSDEITYSITMEDGLFSNVLDISVEGDLDDSDFDEDFVTALATAAAAADGVTFDGVSELTFTEEFSGTLQWTRTLTSSPAADSTHAVRISGNNEEKVHIPVAVSIVDPSDVISHPRLFGWNNSGFEFTPTLPPSDWTFDFAVDKGFNCFRMPYKIERVQPDNFGDIDGDDAVLFKAKVDYALSLGAYVILDPHNYAAKKIGGTDYRIGTPQFPTSAYIDHLVKMHVYIGDGGGKILWCLMNEPVGLPQKTWWNSAQAGVNALRLAGFRGDIQIPGTGFTGAHSWVSGGNAAYALNITDPLDYYSFDVHQYFDDNNAGDEGTCIIGSDSRLNAVTSWATSNSKKLFLGEFAAGDPSVSGQEACDPVLADAIEILYDNSCWVGGAGWGYGDRWLANYHFRALQVDPDTDSDTWYMDTMEASAFITPSVLWTPADEPTAFIWSQLGATDAEAQAEITDTAGIVESWRNKINLSDPFINTNGALQPTYSATFIESSIPGIFFDGTNDTLTMTSQFGVDDEISFAILLAPGAHGATRGHFSFGQFFVSTRSDGTAGITRLGSGLITQTTTVCPADTLCLISGQGKLNTATLQAAVNGVLSGTPNNQSVAFTPGPGTLSNTAAYSNAKINYVAACHKTGDTIRQKLEGHAAWSVNRPDLLPVGHPYKDSPPLL